MARHGGRPLTLAVIPARGGSKGVPRKNLQAIGGVSLLQRAIRAARDSGVVDVAVTSTDDEEIRGAALAGGADVPFLRPAALATDTTPTVDVVAHAVGEYERLHGVAVATIVLLEPTSPFRDASHVRAAVRRHRDGGYAAVVSVCPLERKPENIFFKQPDGALERYIKEPRAEFSTRQAMTHLCRLNSAIYVCDRDTFMNKRSFLLQPLGYVEMTHVESVNIDEPLDVALAELIAARHGL